MIQVVHFKNEDFIVSVICKTMEEYGKIAVYGDYDLDGLFSLLILKDLFHTLEYDENAYLYPYSNRTHNIDFNFLNFCLSRKISLAIICDTGSNDIELLKKFNSYGICCIVLDHHITPYEYCDFPDDNCVVNTSIEEKYGKSSLMCGGGVSFLITSAIFDEKNIAYDKGYFAVYALMAMYADCIEMDTEFGHLLYQLAQSRKSIPFAVNCFLDTGFGITKRFAEYILAPKINAAFRREQFFLINSLFLETNANAFVLVNQLKELHVSTIEIVKKILTDIKYEEVGGMIIANLSLFLNADYPNNFIVNHKGRIANELASKAQKPCICVCDNGKNIEGSLRDPVGHNYLQYFAPLIKAGGHPAAFGFSLPYMDWEYFLKIVKGIGKKDIEEKGIKNTIVAMDYGFDLAMAKQIAYNNEFSSAKSPPVFIQYTLQKIIESTKYGNFAYLIWSDGVEAVWAPSEKKIRYPSSILLYPYLQAKLKLKIIQ